MRLDADLEPVQVGADTFYVCGACAAALAGPGKYQAVGADDRPLAVVLEWLYGNGSLDHWLSDDSYGFAGIVDRYMILEDDRGFVEVREFSSPDAAMREMDGLEDDGFGAFYDDAWVSYRPGGRWIGLPEGGQS